MRFNPATGTVSDIDARIEFRAAAFDPAGRLHTVQGSNVYRVDTSTGVLTRVAGNGIYGGCCDWVPATESSFRQPGHIAFDSLGNLYIPDSFSNSVRVVGTDGIVRPFAGGNYPGGQWGDGGLAVNAGLNWPTSVAVDSNNNVYIADDNGSRIRRVDAQTGIITQFAGAGPSGIDADGFPASQAYLPNIGRMAFDSAGNLVLNVTGNLRIRRINMSTGLMSTIAGNGFYGFSGDGGPATSATLSFGEAFALDAEDNVYIADFGARRLRRVAHDTGIITTVAGNGTEGFCGEVTPAANACLLYPQGLAFDSEDNVFISDSYNGRIRKVSLSDGVLRTIAGGELGVHSGDGGPAINARFGQAPLNIATDALGNLLIAGGYDYRIRRIDAASSIISTIAGTGVNGSSGDGGPATSAQLRLPTEVAVDATGNVYIADMGGHRVRRISSSGVISSIAGTGSSTGALGDGGPATSATLVNPSALAFDNAGHLLISDRGHALIRKVDLATGTITTIAGNGTLGLPSGDGGPALAAAINAPEGIAVDDAGNVFFSTYYGIRRIDAATGLISYVAGRAGGLVDSNGDRVTNPTVLKFDSQGRLYVSDIEISRVWRITGLNTPADTTAPVIESHVTGSVGTDGWYTGNVQVSWSVEDEQSAISSQSGCEATSVTSDTAGITFTCSATSAGGSNSSSITVRRDATAPTLSFGSASPAPGAGGWNSTDVSIPFSTNDAMSGVASASSPSPVVIGGEGANLTSSITVTDNAGNSATFTSSPVNIDRLPPVVQAVVTGTLGTNDWYRSDVQVSWSINKAPASILSSTGCTTTNVTTDTAGVTFSCSVTSAAGTASSSVGLKRDATPPVLTFGTPTPAPNANGWINNKVNVLFTRSDAMSGVNTTSSNSPLVISTDGAGITGQVVVTDRAGNVGTFTTVPLNIDRTPPVVSLLSPANSAVYGLYQNNVVSSFSCTDVSLASCVGTTVSGTPVDTTTSGERSFRVTATDLVNLTTQVTHWYRVASTFNFQGFLAPMNAAPILNQVAPGIVVPIRFRLPDGHGGFVTNTAAFTSATVSSLTCGSATVVPLNDTASGPPGISFDAGTNTFTYHWATDAGWTGCRKLTLRLRDNSQRELRFRFQ